MQIVLFQNSSDTDHVNKTLTNRKEISATLKVDTSATDPTFIFSKSAFNRQYNYAYAPDFGRYYYLGPPVYLAGGMVQVSGHVDVLVSLKSQYINNDAILDRQESEANLYFNDNEFYALNKETINTINFPETLSKTGSLIMLVQGGN